MPIPPVPSRSRTRYLRSTISSGRGTSRWSSSSWSIRWRMIYPRLECRRDSNSKIFARPLSEIHVNDPRATRGSYGERDLSVRLMSGDGPKRLLVAVAILVTGLSSPALAAEEPDQRWGISIWGLSYHIDDHEIDFDE